MNENLKKMYCKSVICEGIFYVGDMDSVISCPFCKYPHVGNYNELEKSNAPESVWIDLLDREGWMLKPYHGSKEYVRIEIVNNLKKKIDLNNHQLHNLECEGCDIQPIFKNIEICFFCSVIEKAEKLVGSFDDLIKRLDILEKDLSNKDRKS